MNTVHEHEDPLDQAEKQLDQLREEVDTERHKDRRSAWIIALALILAALIAGSIVAYSTHEAERQQDNAQSARAGEKAAVVKSSRALSTAAAANSQANKVADPVIQACKTPELRAVLEKSGACQAAAEVKIAGPMGPSGAIGAEGRGVAGTKIVGGNLYVEYTDGSSQDAGTVKGARGVPGPTGPTGRGLPGTDGKNGRSITGTNLANGNLVISYSSGDPAVFGPVVGPKGAEGDPGISGSPGVAGKDGSNGRGVSALAISNGRLIVTYTDGTTSDAGPLPAGPKGDKGDTGATGRGIKSTVCGDDGRWTITYSDDTKADAGVCRTTVTSTTTVTPPADTSTPVSTAP